MSEEEANALANPPQAPKHASDNGEWPALGESTQQLPANGRGKADAAWDDSDEGNEEFDDDVGALSDGELDNDTQSECQPAAVTAFEPAHTQVLTYTHA